VKLLTYSGVKQMLVISSFILCSLLLFLNDFGERCSSFEDVTV